MVEQERHVHGADCGHNGPGPAQQIQRSAVQRTAIVGGARVGDPLALIEENNLSHLLTPTALSVLEFVKGQGDKTLLQAKDAESLAIQAMRTAALIELVRSINSSGILGRRSLSRQGISHTGSNDRGNETALAVNVLDARGARNPEDIADTVTKSLTEPNNGSFSVAMERPQDDDMILDDMSRDARDVELTTAELAEIRETAKGQEELIPYLISAKKQDRLADGHESTLAMYGSLLRERTEDTVMAIIDNPGPDVATLGPHSGAYESDVPSDRIAPGKDGFTSLVLPAWFEPYGLLLPLKEWPAGVALRFAGTKQVTAHFRAKGKDWPITVEAPDYGTEITAHLQKFKLIATHILKTAHA
ncbi:hypothetical protein [Streptomyces sp. NPDC002054]|uniref:hypothetical protein n=1 Tax=Streptomyces sp. NPDC002054 TaxID=3154663 RepID=UPI003318FC94